MITSENLASTVIRHIIFHDVPQKIRGGDAKPLLSDVETALDTSQKAHLKTKLTRVLNSTKAYPVRFKNMTESPVPVEVRRLTKSAYKAEQFVEASHRLANYLFEQHTGRRQCILKFHRNLATLSDVIHERWTKACNRGSTVIVVD